MSEFSDLLNELKNKKANGVHIEPFEELLLSFVPQNIKHIVYFSQTGILRPGNILTIIGHIGIGKSQITESLISSYLNPYVDCLGLRVEVKEDKPLLWLDGERTKDDISTGFDRIKRRIEITNNPELIEDDRFKGVRCYPLITHPNIQARVKELDRLCAELTPGLLVIDGAADFVRNVNDSEESTDFIAQLIALGNKHNFGIVASIHPNPGLGQFNKPRGVLGSELLRKSESVLLLKRAETDRDIRILTMDFAHGKNRNDADNLEHCFAWSNKHKMFMSCNFNPDKNINKAADQRDVFESVLSDCVLTYTELKQRLVNTGKSDRTATRWIKDAVEQKMIFKDDSGNYKLIPF